MSQTNQDHAHVLLPPPLLFAGALLLSLLVDWLFGWHLPMPLFARSLLAVLLMALGAVPLVAALLELKAAKTAIKPWNSTKQIVSSGPYRYTRNPIYVGMALLYLGLVVWLGSGAGFLFLMPALLVLHFGVVLREEAYLLGKFGQPYRDYCATTPRWLQ